MKIAIVIGTRPEIIKMAPVIDEIKKRDIEFSLIHTGQHYDHEMSQQFFQDLELPKPDHNIGVGSKSHAKMTAAVMEGLEDILKEEKPDIVMVQGDTNAVLAGALVASKMHIPVGHVEAGLRSFDKTMPEEINRIVADTCTHLYYTPTEKAALNLLFEGADPENIIITGNTIVDACLRNLEIAKRKSTIRFPSDKIITLTMHRAENVDNKSRLKSITRALLELDNFTIIFPVHPRTRKNLEKFHLYKLLAEAEHIKLVKPLGYLDFLLLLSKSYVVLTDSGGLQEEAITLNIPCLTLRYNTERPETVEVGGNILVGADRKRIVNTLRLIQENPNFRMKMINAPNPYGDGKASKRIINATVDFHNKGKLNIRPPENILSDIQRELHFIEEDITVESLEKRDNCKVRIVYDENKPRFPHQTMNLKGKQIICDIYKIL
ncbi:non-hydrolyzing UDP-N-acetylglucosamine 2-epimerase [Methanothermobacter tenebrarum]|uniref:UDP-N-acetylglucosamine 2-epimerase (Non-hydrolyzing) n=1 Tax=Methanothermobacter tenebrarum TaxID=680118 RepID=A0A328PHT8_9EURY|nr:UDP-N-acetylglucosamine 2-epimerase (non-hydrolyzing) [Methanothermobacter tenebrarum]NPV64899.1 UDP-N-acetylglucosamine 2-epimerase (non-hydrolyzing) [Methanobacteriaceae archaeon]RAO79405.1 UDP-N-acetylglucosamine 2-epimerase (non-hydrolyzing) [Methanothermobacter tenebrarum]